MSEPFEIFLTILGISFWFFFTIGMFITVSKVDKKTKQVVKLSHDSLDSIHRRLVQ